MKILYASNNSIYSFNQLERIVPSLKADGHEVRIAAYKSNYYGKYFNWNLEALFDWKSPKINNVSFSNWNYNILAKEIKEYSPQLIINDLDPHIGLLGLELNIPLWNVSPILFYYAISKKMKYNWNIYKNYSKLLNNGINSQKYINVIINNASKNLVYSPFCETINQFELLDNFNWVRPDFYLSKNNSNDKELIISKDDRVLNKKQYINDLGNASSVIHSGSSIILSDVIYNQKKSIINTNYKSFESIFNTEILKQFEIKLKINDDIRFLNEEIKLSLI